MKTKLVITVYHDEPLTRLEEQLLVKVVRVAEESTGLCLSHSFEDDDEETYTRK